MKSLLRRISLILLISLYPAAALSLASDWQKAEYSSARLVAGELETLSPGKVALSAALEIKLEHGWKTYWRSAGDAGFPLDVEVSSESKNVESAKLHWPFPKRFVEEWGLEVFGFKDRLLIPVTIQFKDPTAPREVKLTAHYAVCSDICLSEEQTFTVTVPTGYQPDPEMVAMVQEAWATVPKENTMEGLKITGVSILRESKDGGVLEVKAETTDEEFINPEVFVEGNAGIRFPLARTELAADKRQVGFQVPYTLSLPAKTLAETKVILTVVHGTQAVEGKFKLGKVPEGGGSVPLAAPELTEDQQVPYGHEITTDNVSLGTMIWLALLGGLILNIMPCVLPVLSLKLLGAVRHGGAHERYVRLSFLMSTAGVLLFFFVLALATIAAKHSGQALGWGLHFQSPVFLIFLILAILLFAANLLGWFEIQLPSWLNNKILSAGMASRKPLMGDFATGMFAALMATPCSAPFLGTAVGFALARGDMEIFTIFMALGIGLATPYILAAIFPKVVTLLPRPGAWMVRVKQFMGVLMLASALWLIWVASQQLTPPVAQVSESVESVSWQLFDEESIPMRVEQGEIVFVDVTADWCLTCKANKLFVLSNEKVQAALRADGLVPMKADLTKPNAKIEKFLRKHGRFGIPFNAVFGKGAPEGIVLSELLSEQEIMAALKKAAGN